MFQLFYFIRRLNVLQWPNTSEPNAAVRVTQNSCAYDLNMVIRVGPLIVFFQIFVL